MWCMGVDCYPLSSMLVSTGETMTCGNLTALLRCQRSKRAAVADSSLGRLHLKGTAIVMMLSMTFAVPSSHAATPSKEIESFKIYAHMKLMDTKQFICLNTLWIKESNWNPKAKNGSHYGIPQLRNKIVKNMNGFQQVEIGLKYIAHRYSLPCNALAFWNHKKKTTGAGWY